MPTMLFTALRKYAVFSGRARRKEFWQFTLLALLLTIAGAALDEVIGLPEFWGAESGWGGPIENLVSITTFVPSVAVCWRWMHDIDMPGWLTAIPLLVSGSLLALVIYVPSIWYGLLPVAAILLSLALLSSLIVLCARDGTVGPNLYGPDPKGSERRADNGT